jgi:hypothetical protein
MLVTPVGIVTLDKLVQSRNAWSTMLVTLFGIAMPVRPQNWNAPNQIRVTLLGIVTLVTKLKLSNARTPTLVTGRPSIVLGMGTTLLVPVYAVIVRVPLLVA